MLLRDYVYDAAVLRCIDGDTVVLRIDLGFYTSVETPVRLIGINAPERKLTTREAGDTARDWLDHLCKTYRIDNDSLFPVLRIKSHTGIRSDKYGRWLVELFGTADDGSEINLNQRMIEDGHAVHYMM